MYTLIEYKSKAAAAHNGTSFDPEKRGEQLIKDYENQLNQDVQALEYCKIDQDQINDYVKRYKSLFATWLNAKSNCTSTMITGPANYNMNRHEKTQRSESRHYDLWQHWRKRAVAAIIRKAKEPKTYESELDRYKAELSEAQRLHNLSIEGNKRIKQAKKTGEDIDQYLTQTFNVKPHMLEHTKKWGFGTTNSNARIKRLEQMIKNLESKQASSLHNGDTKVHFENNRIKVVINYALDRVQIITESKPDQTVISLFKSSGLKWAPSQQAWQRQYTQNAMYVINHLIKNSFQ